MRVLWLAFVVAPELLFVSCEGHYRLQAGEAVVIREIKTIHAAEAQYESEFGAYAASLKQLGPPANGGAPNPHAADLIPASLASGNKDGYLFILTSTAKGYVIQARPKVYKQTGRRTFYSDQTGLIRQSRGPEPATASSPELR